MRRPEENPHFVIDGLKFKTGHHAYLEAKKRGFKGSKQCFQARLRRHNTWAEMLRPVNASVSAARKATTQRKHDEMAAVIAALDARKAGAV